LVKSPLENSWTFWYIKPDKRPNFNWENALIKLIDVKFVEDFWATYNHLALPSKLSAAKSNCDYYFFKTGVKPMWEDDSNKFGGRWMLNFGRDEHMSYKLDDIWQETLLAMIGDLFSVDNDVQPLSRFITGCVISIRQRGHKAALWLSESRNEYIIKEIGRRWKRMMNLHTSVRIQFDLHNESGGGHGGGQQRPMFEE